MGTSCGPIDSGSLGQMCTCKDMVRCLSMKMLRHGECYNPSFCFWRRFVHVTSSLHPFIHVCLLLCSLVCLLRSAPGRRARGTSLLMKLCRTHDAVSQVYLPYIGVRGLLFRLPSLDARSQTWLSHMQQLAASAIFFTLIS